MPLQLNDILHDRYRIEGQLGKGGMGVVFLAYDLTLDIKFAVKENLNLSPESERQFRREAPANRLTQDHILDPMAKIPEYKVSAVRLENPRAR